MQFLIKKKSSVWLGWCCWLIFRVCNQPKHLLSYVFVLRSSCCVIHADWLPWNHDNWTQPSSFCTQFVLFCFFWLFFLSPAQWVCVHTSAGVCVFVHWIYGVAGGGVLRYPSAYLHQNDWLCCQQWLWPSFERQPHAVWLKATRPCKYKWCSFMCSLHSVWKVAVWLIKQVQGVDAAT